jgi:hypothetical protein
MKAMEHAQAMKLTFDADGVATPGAQHFCLNIFGLREEQRRDIFERATMLERFYQKCQQRFKSIFSANSNSAAAVTGTIAVNLLLP